MSFATLIAVVVLLFVGIYVSRHRARMRPLPLPLAIPPIDEQDGDTDVSTFPPKVA